MHKCIIFVFLYPFMHYLIYLVDPHFLYFKIPFCITFAAHVGYEFPNFSLKNVYFIFILSGVITENYTLSVICIIFIGLSLSLLRNQPLTKIVDHLKVTCFSLASFKVFSLSLALGNFTVIY